MLEKKATEFIDVLSSAAPVPGGGGASATVGALASALGLMVTNLTVGKKRYADVEEEIVEIREKLTALRDELILLTDKDAEAFEPLSKAYKLPKGTPEELAEKEAVMEKALYEASIVPIQIMETIYQVLRLLEVLGKKGSRMAASDVGVGALFARSALEGASYNVYINTKSMKNRELADDLNEKADRMIEEARRLETIICADIMKQIR
jgi:formiminotetrahydrofolate cyclodeaminase